MNKHNYLECNLKCNLLKNQTAVGTWWNAIDTNC